VWKRRYLASANIDKFYQISHEKINFPEKNQKRGANSRTGKDVNKM
jgi:hypothetical protein